MAKCEFCDREMKLANSCRRKSHGQIPFGDEHLSGFLMEIPVYKHGRCPTCGVERGGFHHLRCDIEECPQCHGQLTSCKCESKPAFVVIKGGKGKH